MRRLWAGLNVILRGKLIGCSDIGRHFSKICTETFKKMYTIQNDEDQVSEKNQKLFFLSIRYRKTSQTQDVKRQSTERSIQKKAQPKRDSAFEQKTRIVPAKETSGSSQNLFFSYNQRKNQSRAKTDIFDNVLNVILESWCFLFGEISHYLSDCLYENHQTNCTHSQTTKTTFPKKSKAVFLSFRYHKSSQTQDVKSQSTKRSLRKLVQAKPNTAVEQNRY